MSTESLTIRILGDSSGLRAELEAATGELEAFEQRLSALTGIGQRVSESFAGISSAAAPLQQVSSLLSGVFKQMQVISGTPLTINVQPALAALLQLAAAVEAVAARLRALSATPGPAAGGGGSLPANKTAISPAPLISSAAASPALPPVLTASAPSAALTPASLTDRLKIPAATVPTTVSAKPAAEWSLALSTFAPPSAADRPPVPLPDLQRSTDIMRDRDRSTAPRTAPFDEPLRRDPDRRPPEPSGPTTTNHFGGITIQVRETADLNALVRDLRLQGIQLRHRRG